MNVPDKKLLSAYAAWLTQVRDKDGNWQHLRKDMECTLTFFGDPYAAEKFIYRHAELYEGDLKDYRIIKVKLEYLVEETIVPMGNER
jgi:hypothetical protein